MSIRDDFSMYYCDSYLGVHRDGNLLPFYIESVYYKESFDEESSYPDTLEQALSMLIFEGTLGCDENGRTRGFSIDGDDPALEFEALELGYYKDTSDNWIWNSYSTQHSVKKGLTYRRLHTRGEFNFANLYRMFNAEVDGSELLHKDILFHNGKLINKGLQIGTQTDSTVELVYEYRLLQPWIQELLPQCQITIGQQR